MHVLIFSHCPGTFVSPTVSRHIKHWSVHKSVFLVHLQSNKAGLEDSYNVHLSPVLTIGFWCGWSEQPSDVSLRVSSDPKQRNHSSNKFAVMHGLLDDVTHSLTLIRRWLEVIDALYG